LLRAAVGSDGMRSTTLTRPDEDRSLADMEHPVRTRQWTRAEYDRLIEIGVFQPR